MSKIILLFYFIISISTFSLNFSIAPTKFDLDLSKNETKEAYIINNTSSPLRVEIYLDKAEGYENKDLNSNIVIFPKLISIKPGGKQSVRFKVKSTENLEKGKYKSLLVFREKPKEIKQKIQESEKFSTEFKFITEIAIGVTGEKR
mgnify:CR=1 FL=1|jgi:P pilus assembly chaperone PapD